VPANFAAIDTRVHDEVTWWLDEPVVQVPPEHGLLATILERLLERAGGEHARADRARLDDASWVGFRLAEFLPLETSERQHLLQLDDPLARLEQLTRCIPRFQSA
ncbi:MAG TPA: peptidase S16, partial [Tahibacter sp.]|nr:peptidase S16 [Tahibacter sp.]